MRAAAKKAVIYVRISTKKQEKKGSGLLSQEVVCRDFADHNNYDVLEVYSDKETGSKKDRDGIIAMLRFLKKACKKEPYTVIIDDLNRMARDVRVHFDLRDEILATGALLDCPKWKFGESAHDRYVETVVAAGSQYMRDQNTEQSHARKKGRALDGYYPFNRVYGYSMNLIEGRGHMLIRDEPLASIIQEALEGYASGRFQLKAEVKRFLEEHPAFPKNRYGVVTNETVNRILNRVLYAGMIEVPQYGVTLRNAQHEGLITYETFLKIQDRMREGARTPARADIEGEFPLRGQVVCSSCGGKLTGGYARSKTGKRHGYYNCYNRKCAEFRKSIRQFDLESEFEELLTRMTPAPATYKALKKMLEILWERIGQQSKERLNEIRAQIHSIDKRVDGLINRVAEEANEKVADVCLKKVGDLESQKVVLEEKMERTGEKKEPFSKLYELACDFIENPLKLWHSEHLEHKQTVLKLVFSAPPQYTRNKGYTNPNLSLPFKALSGLKGGVGQCGGDEGIRTLDTLLGHTPLAGERLQPLGHVSVAVSACKSWQRQDVMMRR